MRISNATNLKLKGIDVQWDKPALDKWQSALELNNVQRVVLDDFTGRQAWADSEYPALAFENVSDALIRHSAAADGTGLFLKVSGSKSSNLCLFGNDLRKAKSSYQLAPEAKAAKVISLQNLVAVK
jgi:hypothetical protein